MLNMAIIGYGSVAQYVVKRIGDHPLVNVRTVICREGRDAVARTALGEDIVPIHTADGLDGSIGLVVDCAGHSGLQAHGAGVLARGIDLTTVSTGALADARLAIALEDAARAGGAQLQLVAGAIGAIDALAAAKLGGLSEVTYTGRKPPSGWAGSPAEQCLDLEHLSEPAVHFSGSARDAALRYPKNANVAATVALAGIGLDETGVRLIADPTIEANCHEVEASGAFGAFTFRIEGAPLPSNPKSSALTAMSAVRSILNHVQPVVI